MSIGSMAHLFCFFSRASQKGISKPLYKHYVSVIPIWIKTANLSQLLQTFTTPSTILYRAEGCPDKDQDICNIYACYMAMSFCHICNSHIIVFGILVPLKQSWRIQDGPKQSHRCRCSADSPRLPDLERSDYLQSFPSRTLPESAIINTVRLHRAKYETKQSRNQLFANVFFKTATDTDKPRSSTATAEFLTFCLWKIYLPFQKNWLSDISIFTIILLPAVNKNSPEKLSTYVCSTSLCSMREPHSIKSTFKVALLCFYPLKLIPTKSGLCRDEFVLFWAASL